MNKAKEFLQRHGQTSEAVDAQAQMRLFAEKMELGFHSYEHCMPMLPTYLCNIDRHKIKQGKNILIDAGGTNFRSALGYFEGGKAHIEKLQKTAMPASRGETLSKTEFYDRIAANIAYLADDAENVGFCFSYAARMFADLDGQALGFSKEIRAPQVVGTRVGAETLQALSKHSDKKRKIVILNDTVATLLGGMAIADKHYSTYLGYIYGTGTNLCCIADTAKITKETDLPAGRMLVNMECGGYDGFVAGDFDKAAISRTDAPNRQLFEKMTSGKYLAEIIFEALSVAQREGEFCGEVRLQRFALSDVSAFLQDDGTMPEYFALRKDAEFARDVCRLLVDRAAKMGAIVNAATAIETCTDKSLPVAVVAEGTTFNRLVGYRERFESYLTELLGAEGITFEIIQGEELNLVGTLMASMLL